MYIVYTFVFMSNKIVSYLILSYTPRIWDMCSFIYKIQYDSVTFECVYAL